MVIMCLLCIPLISITGDDSDIHAMECCSGQGNFHVHINCKQ